jgi:hypothetical protein
VESHHVVVDATHGSDYCTLLLLVCGGCKFGFAVRYTGFERAQGCLNDREEVLATPAARWWRSMNRAPEIVDRSPRGGR